jgi:hypothetical protein
MGPVYILAAALVVAFLALIGLKLARMISREGFETMKDVKDFLALETEPLSTICPNNGVLIGRVTVPKINEETVKTILYKAFTDPLSLFTGGIAEIAWACYPSGVTNVNSIYQSDPTTSPSGVMIFGPKGSTIDLYSEKDAKGKIVKTVSDYTSSIVKGCPEDIICSDAINFRNLQFSSVKITLAPNIVPPPITPPLPIVHPPPQSCPTLSPAAAAAAAAADAKEKENAVKAAAIADATSKAISKSVMSSISDPDFGSATGSALTSDSDGNMVSLSCPSGDKPKISFVRNTRNAIPTTVDTNTLSGVRGANRSSSDSCPESSPAPAIGRGTGGGYYFDPEKDC